MKTFDPRNNADDAYTVFTQMPRSEWRALLHSLIQGGVLTPAEQEGFERARAVWLLRAAGAQ